MFTKKSKFVYLSFYFSFWMYTNIGFIYIYYIYKNIYFNIYYTWELQLVLIIYFIIERSLNFFLNTFLFYFKFATFNKLFKALSYIDSSVCRNLLKKCSIGFRKLLSFFFGHFSQIICSFNKINFIPNQIHNNIFVCCIIQFLHPFF